MSVTIPFVPNSNRKSSMALQRGFTLIEITVAIFGFVIIIFGLLAMFSGLFRFTNQQSTLLSDQDQARKLAAQIAVELRNGQTGSNGAYVLDTAGPQQLIFYSFANSSQSIRRIRYFVQNGQLWKGITPYNGTTYPVANEVTTAVQNNLANGNSPVFSYFDGNFTGGSTQSPLAQPVNVTQVKFIKISLVIYNKAGVANSNVYTVTGGAAVRNLKTNLGQ